MEIKVLVAGASGALGIEVMQLLSEKGLALRGLVYGKDGESVVAPFTDDIWQTDASDGAKAVEGITAGITHIISTMGKSVSLFTTEGESFMASDFEGNSYLVEHALGNQVQRFVYVSIKGADTAQDYEIAKAHKEFEDTLRTSGLDYTIIRPVGFFSGLHDLAIMAKRGIIPMIGDGTSRTNSIHQKDLAVKVVSLLEDGPNLLEVGGPKIHTRKEMAELVQEFVGGEIISVPEKIADIGLLLPELISNNMAAKLEYFKYITSNDMIGEKTGSTSFREYLESLDLNKLP